MDDIRDRCRELIDATAPGLAARGYRLLSDCDVPVELRDGCAYGWCLRGEYIPHPLRDALPGWQAGQAVVVLRLSDIAADAIDLERAAMMVTLHETAHALPLAPAVDLAATLPDSPSMRAAMIEKHHSGGGDAEEVALGARDPHGPQFIRRCCHLYVRAAEAGFDLPWHDLLGPRTWQGRLHDYLPYCLSEALRMRGESFTTIDNEPMPAGLSERYAADVEFFNLTKGANHANNPRRPAGQWPAAVY